VIPVKIRLEEIADRAGVSISTVSRVLNGKPGVNPATRRLVLTAVDVLGYDRPTRLRPRTAGLVGVVVPELENPFFPRFAQFIEVELGRNGYTPVLCSQSLGGVHEDEFVQTLLEHGVAGLIVVSGVHAVADSDPARYLRLTDSGLPLTLVNGYLPTIPAAFVSSDDRAAIELGVAHLANMGHERIGVALGQDRYTPVMRKVAGFRAAMARHLPEQAELDELIACTSFTVEGGTQAAKSLLAAGATGIICGSDVMAMGVVRGVRQAGLSVPADVSVVGSDDSLFNEFLDPPLSSIRPPSHAMAVAACSALLHQIGGAPADPDEMLFQPELIVRGSTGRARTDGR
jgi:DNA-binding LacI/PurR family transcriptional regulator